MIQNIHLRKLIFKTVEEYNVEGDTIRINIVLGSDSEKDILINEEDNLVKVKIHFNLFFVQENTIFNKDEDVPEDTIGLYLQYELTCNYEDNRKLLKDDIEGFLSKTKEIIEPDVRNEVSHVFQQANISIPILPYRFWDESER